MAAFELLPAAVRAVFALWALLLCLVNLGSLVLAAVKKHIKFTAFALLLFAPAYALWQVIFDFSLFGQSGKTAHMSRVLCALPGAVWFFVFAGVTAATAVLFARNVKYDKTYITPGTIKTYLDKIPCGICCWRDNGRVLFSNECMNALCEEICGEPLLDGNRFFDAVQGGIINRSDTVWRFVRRDIEKDGEHLYEMVASDITAEYAKTRALEQDKEALARLNADLRAYYASIDESVKRQEILQAKINIHDEMNRLMLSTVAAAGDDSETLNHYFSLWEQNALLLCLEADRKSRRQQGATESLAGALGIRLEMPAVLPEGMSEKQKELFFCVAQEALANAAKHADAAQMEITIEQTPAALICRFANDGTAPQAPVRFVGGLANIAALAEKQGAKVYTEPGERFVLVLEFSRSFHSLKEEIRNKKEE